MSADKKPNKKNGDKRSGVTAGSKKQVQTKRSQNSKYAQNKTVKRRKYTAQLARIVDAALDPVLKQGGFVKTEIVKKWPDIVGIDFARVSVPAKISFLRGQRGGGSLTIRCESAFAPLLQHKIPIIIERVNRYFGYSAVEVVQIRQGPVGGNRERVTQLTKKLTIDAELCDAQEQKLDNLTRDIADNELRAALKKLGEAVYTQKKYDKT